MKHIYLSLVALSLCASTSLASAAPSTIALAPERAGHNATVLTSGKVLITGGVNETAALDSALLYDPATGNFTPTGTMTTPRSYHTSTLLQDGCVLLTGGVLSTGQLTKTAELYDPNTGFFTQVAHQMSVGRSKHTANLRADGKVIIVGGKNADLFDPATESRIR